MIVALGGNLPSEVGTPKVTLGQAVEALRLRGAVIRGTSRFYQTPCFPAGAGPDYVNAAILMEASWAPEEALVHLHAVEHEFGRARTQRWGMRTLDLDLVACEDRVLPDRKIYQHWLNLTLETQKISAPEHLILPHPRLQDRAFVLVPMADVAPDWVHPILGQTVLEMRDALPQDEIDAVVALEG